MTVRVCRAETDEERADALDVREVVFVEEQGVPPDVEVDGEDPHATHFVAPRRGEGIGRALMAELEATADERGIELLTLHAQTHVESFYHALGYETTSDVFEEAGIDHVEMEKPLR